MEGLVNLIVVRNLLLLIGLVRQWEVLCFDCAAKVERFTGVVIFVVLGIRRQWFII